MAKDIIDKLLDHVFDDKFKGWFGEKLTEHELNIVRLFGRGGKVLRNVYVPKDDNEYSEIDVLFITQKGIYVIESKNYSGWIFGDEKSMYWTASLPNGQKNRFYNPIKQNASHLKWLASVVADDIPLFSVIVFSERCELKKIEINSQDIKVIKRDRLYATVRDIWEHSEDALSGETIQKLYEELGKMRNVDKATKQEHINTINEKYKKPESEEKLCPRCGSKLVVRTAKKGENAGNQFYGCSAFPKCRYMGSINGESK